MGKNKSTSVSAEKRIFRQITQLLFTWADNCSTWLMIRVRLSVRMDWLLANSDRRVCRLFWFVSKPVLSSSTENKQKICYKNVQVFHLCVCCIFNRGIELFLFDFSKWLGILTRKTICFQKNTLMKLSIHFLSLCTQWEM